MFVTRCNATHPHNVINGCNGAQLAFAIIPPLFLFWMLGFFMSHTSMNEDFDSHQP